MEQKVKGCITVRQEMYHNYLQNEGYKIKNFTVAKRMEHSEKAASDKAAD